MTFAYHRSLAPMMWVFFGLVIVEMLVVHGLVAMWTPWVALGLSSLSLPALIWVVLVIRSFRAMPVRIADGQLHWPAGRLRTVAVPLAQVKGLLGRIDGALVKDRATFNAALMAWPNVMVELADPLPGRGPISRLAHKLDDPAPFVAALAALGLAT